jgi:hypothetical protein
MSASVAELLWILVRRFPSKESSRLRNLSSISPQDRKIKANLSGRACETSDAVQGTLTVKDLHHLHSHGCGDVFREVQSKPEFNERFGGRGTRDG